MNIHHSCSKGGFIITIIAMSIILCYSVMHDDTGGLYVNESSVFAGEPSACCTEITEHLACRNACEQVSGLTGIYRSPAIRISCQCTQYYQKHSSRHSIHTNTYIHTHPQLYTFPHMNRYIYYTYLNNAYIKSFQRCNCIFFSLLPSASKYL